MRAKEIVYRKLYNIIMREIKPLFIQYISRYASNDLRSFIENNGCTDLEELLKRYKPELLPLYYKMINILRDARDYIVWDSYRITDEIVREMILKGFKIDTTVYVYIYNVIENLKNKIYF